MKIAIVGSGAMGQLFGARLQLAGNQVVFFDTQQGTIDVLRSKGITLVDELGSEHVPVTIMRAQDATEPFELIIIFTKGLHTRSAVESVRHLVGPATLGLTLQNGLGHAETLAEVFGKHRTLAGVTDFPADPREPGIIGTSTRGTVRMGSIWAEDAGREVASVFSQAGLNAVQEHQVLVPIWEKVTFNSALNTLSGVTGLTVGGIGASTTALQIVEQIVEECDLVAQAQGVRISVEHVTGALSNAFEHHMEHKTSMLLDREAGRATEVDFIGGAVADLGRSLGIATPVLDTLCQLMRTVTELPKKDAALAS